MSATIATLPRAGGNGAALVVVVADLLIGLFAVVKNKTAPKAAVEKSAKELGFWQLYRLTVGYDFISPKVAAKLRKELIG
jgi:hypothetical protein